MYPPPINRRSIGADVDLIDGSLTTSSITPATGIPSGLAPVHNIALRIPREVLERRHIRITKDVINWPIPVEGNAAVLAAFMRNLIEVGPSHLTPEAVPVLREHAL